SPSMCLHISLSCSRRHPALHFSLHDALPISPLLDGEGVRHHEVPLLAGLSISERVILDVPDRLAQVGHVVEVYGPPLPPPARRRDRKSTRLTPVTIRSRMPSSA